MFTISSCSINVTATSKNDASSFHMNQTIVSAGKHFSNTNPSDLSIVDACDIFVYRMRYQIM